MVASPHLTPSAADPMAAVRALNRMRRAGFTLTVQSDRLIVVPASTLNEQQRAFIREHKAALVQLLTDAETVYSALQAAGGAGIGWHEGTPPEWTDARLLAAGEVLYSDGRMVNRLDSRYCTTDSGGIPPETAPVSPEERPIPPDEIMPPPYRDSRDGGINAALLPPVVSASPVINGGISAGLAGFTQNPEPNDTPAIPAAPAKTPKCVWGRWGDRLVMKCNAPEPNADGTGCANCGARKAGPVAGEKENSP